MNTLNNLTPGAGLPSFGDIFGAPKENASNVVGVEGASERFTMNSVNFTFTAPVVQGIVTMLKGSSQRAVTKVWRNADEKPEVVPDKNWPAAEHYVVTDLQSLFTTVKLFANNATHSLLRYVHKDHRQAQNGVVHNTLRNGEVFEDVEQPWLMLDVDGFAPEQCDYRDLAGATKEYITKKLPVEFHTADFFVGGSSSYCMPGKEGLLKAHIFFWLKTPVKTAVLSQWAKSLGKDSFVDSALYNTVQQHFIANPVFTNGLQDPVAERWVFVREQMREVTLNITADQLTRAEQKADRASEGPTLKDPRTKPGVIGVFHKVVTVEELLFEELTGDFERGTGDRHTWLKSKSTSPGSVYINRDRMHVGANNDSWPFGSNETANLFDVLRVLKFGHLDAGQPEGTPVHKLPSYAAAIARANQMIEAKAAGALEEHDRAIAAQKSAEQDRIFVDFCVAPPTAPVLGRNPTAVQAALDAIKAAPTVEALRDDVVSKIKSLTGITETDSSNALAWAFKHKLKELGGEKMNLPEIVPLLMTDEQTAFAVALKDYAAEQKKAIKAQVAEAKVLARKADLDARLKALSAGRVNLGYIDARLNEVAHAASRLFVDEVFSRGGKVVRIYRPNETDSPNFVAAKTDSIVEATAPWMLREVSKRAVFTDVKGTKPMDCSEQLARVLVSGVEDGAYPELTGVVAAPFLRKDGSICNTPGYDPETGLWLDLRVDVPPIPDYPSKADAEAARDRLLALVKEFPFVDEAARAVWFADLLGAVARPALPTCLGVLYTAPRMGTGKSLLLEVVNRIAYGECNFSPFPMKEEELKKQVTSVLLAGAPYLCYDNVKTGWSIKSETLNMLLTSQEYSDRILGATSQVKFVNKMRVAFTGNNVSIAEDLVRRFMVCSIDANMEVTTNRTFSIPNLKEHVSKNRGAYLADVLTILRAGILATDKPYVQRVASFESWSEMVQSTVVWLGLSNPAETMRAEESSDTHVAAAFIAIEKALNVHTTPFGEQRFPELATDKRFTAATLSALAKTLPELRGALEEADLHDVESTKIVGRWLTAHKDAIHNGVKLKRTVDTHTKTNKYALVRVDS